MSAQGLHHQAQPVRRGVKRQKDYLDVVLDVVVQQASQGCDLIRPDIKTHHCGNLLPVPLMQASIADGSDEGQQLLEACDLGLALLCNLGWGFHDRLGGKGLHSVNRC